jgi:hypothetical protein
VPEEGE